MRDNWTDFEKFVFKELKTISKEIYELKGKSAAWGAFAGAVAACLGDLVLKFLHVK